MGGVSKQLRTDWAERSVVVGDRTLILMGPWVLPSGSLFNPLYSASPPTYAVRQRAIGLADRGVVGEVIEAFAPLQRSGAYPQLPIGGGPRCVPLEGPVGRPSLEQSTTFLGWVPRDRLPEFSRSMDRFVSISRSESWDVAETEVMASRLAVLSIHMSGARVQHCSPDSELLLAVRAVRRCDRCLWVLVGDTNLGGMGLRPLARPGQARTSKPG